jgi:hypothetical protein
MANNVSVYPSASVTDQLSNYYYHALLRLVAELRSTNQAGSLGLSNMPLLSNQIPLVSVVSRPLEMPGSSSMCCVQIW